MMVRRVRVVESRGYVRGDVAPVLAPIIVDGPEGMQRRQSAVDKARQRMELGRLPSDEITIQIGSQLMHSTAIPAIGAPSDGGQHFVYAAVEVLRGADLSLDVETSSGGRLQISSSARERECEESNRNVTP
jgi:hypothetical protein